MDLLTLAIADGKGCFDDAEANQQLSGAPPLTWKASSNARGAAEGARRLRKLGNLDGAAEAFEAAARSGHPDAAGCCGMAGDCYGRAGQLEAALRAFSAAVELEPDAGKHWHGRAFTLRMLGRDVEAAQDAARAVAEGCDAAEKLLNELAPQTTWVQCQAVEAPVAGDELRAGDDRL
jgi:tetratricopeptide (TPR) repeat protein